MGRLVLVVVLAFLAYACGGATPTEPVAVESIPLAPRKTDDRPKMDAKNNLLGNSDFESGITAPWMPVILEPASADGAVRDGAFCVDISNVGKNPWDIQMSHRGLHLENGHKYYIRARVWATKETNIRGKVGMSHAPYSEYWAKQIVIGEEPSPFLGEFVLNANSDPTAEFAFHVGSGVTDSTILPITVCLDDVSLMDPEVTKSTADTPVPVPEILVNQVGYLPGLKKSAVLRSESKSPLPWTLMLNDTVVVEGKSAVFGPDVASGQHVHLIDFSEVDTPAKGYVIHVEKQKSHPFDISSDLYAKMKYDALAYFYHNRSSVPIDVAYVKDEKWARPAGHPQDVAVPCLPEVGCSRVMDVSGGWYDAGDHGKYVVNAGYSVWAMLNQYERARYIGKSEAAFKDGAMEIPEKQNGVPDLLDEARFELEFMLKMEVPKGEKLVGMAYHKIHDEEWTGIPSAPHKNKTKRYIHAPSTAATLNLSAVAAQAARIWKTLDPAFSKKCLAAAERTFEAARKHPDIYATKADTKGGGAYEDGYVGDEFYWAAAELFITTGNKKYLKLLKASPHFGTLTSIDSVAGRGLQKTPMSWQLVDALGTISLAVVPSKLKKGEVEKLKNKIVQAADADIEVISNEGYRVPFSSRPRADYYWGSNFVVMNNLIILALANDFTSKSDYRNALVEGMDYLLGKNPMDQCYVTGYGARPLRNPHHRFWAHQADNAFPPPPPGAISGGPNQHMQDPMIIASVPGKCAPATCFVDHIDSYSTNEVAINWNAAFAWVTAYLDEMAKKQAKE